MKQFTVLILFMYFYGVSAQSNEILFAQANKHYNSGEFQAALEMYESIVNDGLHSAEVYFNMGNTYYKMNRTAPAIYNFEKALLLAPHDKDIINNLAFAQNMTVDNISALPEDEVSSFFNTLIYAFTIDGWAYIATIGLLFFLFFFLLYYLNNFTSTKRIFFGASLIALVLGLASMAFAYQQQHAQKKVQAAIIFEKEITFRSEPNFRSEEIVLLHEGTKLYIVETIEDWAKVKLANGTLGWMPKEAIKAIVF